MSASSERASFSRSFVDAIILGATPLFAAMAFKSTRRSSQMAMAWASNGVPFFKGGMLSRSFALPRSMALMTCLPLSDLAKPSDTARNWPKSFVFLGAWLAISNKASSFSTRPRGIFALWASFSRHAASSINMPRAFLDLTRIFMRFQASTGWIS